MRKYFIAKDEAERDDALQRIKALGYTWTNGISIDGFTPLFLGIIYDTKYGGIKQVLCQCNGKRTTIARFLLDLEIEKLKAKKRALPKLGEK